MDVTRRFKWFFQLSSTVESVRKLLVPVCGASDISAAIINSLAGFPHALVDGLSEHKAFHCVPGSPWVMTLTKTGRMVYMGC